MKHPLIYVLVQNVVNGSGHKRIKKYLKQNIPVNATVLDLGCGTGEYSLVFKNYTGLDNNPKDIKYAEQKYKGIFMVGDASNMTQIKDNSFDAVFSVGLHHHLTDEKAKKAIIEALRVIKKGGKVIIIDAMFPVHAWNIIGLVIRKLDRGGYIRQFSNTLKLLPKKIQYSFNMLSTFPLDFICITIVK